jgi:phage tail P2-like protein
MTINNQNNQTLLPLNATDLLKDLENNSLSSTTLEALNQYVLNPNKAPEHILPWLAFAVSVDDWSDNWTDEVKRNVIKASVEVHKKKGTIGALRKSLEAFNYEDITVEEWFDYKNEEDGEDEEPYFFRVFFNIVEAGFDVNIMPEVHKVINNTKNVRSHLRSLKAFLSAQMAQVHMGAVITSKEVTPLGHFIYETDDIVDSALAETLVASAFFAKEIITARPIIYDGDDKIETNSNAPYVGSAFFTQEFVTTDFSIPDYVEQLENISVGPYVGAFSITKEITTINPLN